MNRKIPIWKKIPEYRHAPAAFLVEEFAEILKVAGRRKGAIAGIPEGRWWESLLLSIWYTGSRVSAIMQVRWADVLKDGFYLRAEFQKQKADQFFVVGEDCLQAIRRIKLPHRELVWPWDASRRTLFRKFSEIVKKAGVPPAKGAGTLFHRIRKSTASYVRASGGDATSQLGHSSSAVTARYYDPRIVGAHNATSAMPAVKWRGCRSVEN